jgi:NAD-specific glutamate dehydrogenase
LVIGVGGEDLRLLGGDSGVTLDKSSHDTTSGLNTERERSNIEKKEILGLLRGITSQDSSLDGSTVGDSLIGVDGLVGLLTVEEVRDHLLDLGDTGGTTNKDNIVDRGLVNLGVTENLLNGFHGVAEKILVEFLETGTGQGSVEINTLEQGIDFDGGLSSRRESTLSTLASSAETTDSTGVARDILLVLALELLNKVVDETVIEIFTTKMGVTSSSLDLEDTIFNGKEGDIEGTTTKIEDENVAL